MARLNQNLTDQLAQTNQSMTNHMVHITSRLDRLEASTPTRTFEAQIEPNPKPKLDTPNPRRPNLGPLFKPNSRRPNQDPYLEPNPRRPSQDPYFESNPRRPSLDPYIKPNPRRLNQEPFFKPNPRRPNFGRVYDPNLTRPDQDHMDQEDKTLRSIKLQAPTFNGKLDPKAYVNWEREMDQFFE